MASTEMLAMQIWNQLYDAHQESGEPCFMLLNSETENNFVEYFGNEKMNKDPHYNG